MVRSDTHRRVVVGKGDLKMICLEYLGEFNRLKSQCPKFLGYVLIILLVLKVRVIR